MFEEPKSVLELCTEFKTKLEKHLKETGKDIAIIKLKELESFFKYSAKNYSIVYIPKKVYDTFREIGVRFRKKHKKNIFYVRVLEV